MPALVYFHKQFMPVSEAKISIMTHAFHYGTACFEGIRANWNQEKQQMYVFRMKEHYERLQKSCRILKIKLPGSIDHLCQITAELVERSGFKEDVYIRPLAYKSSEVIGPKLYDLEDDFFVHVAQLPMYLDTEKGIKACVSSWRRTDDSMIPPRGKITGIYVNSALAKTEAHENGYDEAIMLSHDGHVSEGSGQNIMLVMDGKFVTPQSSDNILMGITRDSVMKLARNELGMEVVERTIDRSELYIADECMVTGTASHVTPVLEIDHRPIGDGKIGKVTRQLMTLYFDVIHGRNQKYMEWCAPALRKTVKA
ncbi:MAG: branched-chain amino acid transaminase [Chloroflexi bacterium]|nr:branched-chain amino acid transaminase [Chloroflexota bacterium]